MAKHYINEVGTDILLDAGISLTDINEQQIRYMAPGAVLPGSWVASIYSSWSELAKEAATSFVKYTLAAGDITDPGEWQLQAWVASGTGTWLSETVTEQYFDLFQ